MAEWAGTSQHQLILDGINVT